MSKDQEAGYISRVGFACSNWPHLHRAYVVTVRKLNLHSIKAKNHMDVKSLIPVSHQNLISLDIWNQCMKEDIIDANFVITLLLISLIWKDIFEQFMERFRNIHIINVAPVLTPALVVINVLRPLKNKISQIFQLVDKGLKMS